MFKLLSLLFQKSVFLIGSAFGLGFSRVAPGTIGALFGVPVFLGLVHICNEYAYAIALSCLFLCSVVFGGLMERKLGEKDASCIVIDEWSAVVFFLSPWPYLDLFKFKSWPDVSSLIGDYSFILASITGFILFRIIDIWKPGIVNKSQNLPGGWGITIDDWLAAFPSVIVLSVFYFYVPHDFRVR